MSPRHRGAPIKFGFGFFGQTLLAIDRRDHAVEVRALGRKFDGFFQFHLRFF